MPLASKTKLRCSAAHTQLVSLQWYGVVRDEVLAEGDRGNSAAEEMRRTQDAMTVVKPVRAAQKL